MNFSNRRFLLLYGWQGSNSPHWQAWLHEKLQENGVKSSFPQLSDNHLPQKSVWLDEAQKAFNQSQPDVVITHSLGAIVWFHLCNEKRVQQIEHLILVAPPRDLRDYEALRSFFPVSIPNDVLAKHVHLITSSDDPYMDQDEIHALVSQLRVQHTQLEAAGHINSDSGYGAWPWIYEYCKDLE